MTMKFTVTNTVPGNLDKRLVSLIQDVAEELVGEAKKELDNITRDWSNKPEFRTDTSISGNLVKLSVLTNSEIFNWVDKGVEPHEIVPNSARRLSLKLGYVPRTRPGSTAIGEGFREARSERSLRLGIGSARRNLPLGQSTRRAFAMHVNHPGIEARDISGTVIRPILSRVNRRLNDRLIRANFR